MTSRMIIPTDRSKIIQIDYDTWLNASDEPICINLTKRDVVAIYAQLEFLQWRTRWTNIPDDFNQLQYAQDLQNRILTQMICWNCEQTIACLLDELETNTALAQAIKKSLVGIGFPPDYPYVPFEKGVPIPESVREIEVPIPSCDLDILWGACISVVNNLADLMENFLQEVEAEGSQAKIILKVIDAIPALGAFVDETIVADIYEFTQVLKSELVASYIAGDDIARRTEIACLIFCICRDKCTISFDDIGQAFSDFNVLALTDPFNIIAILSALSVGSLPNDLVFTGMIQLALVAVQTGNYFNGLFGGENFNKFIIEESFDEPSSDWEIFCTDCNDASLLEISDTNGSPTLSIDGTGLYTLTVSSNSFASLRLIGGDGTCSFSFTITDITVVTGAPTGRSWLACPSGTFVSANAPVTDAEGVLLSTVSFSNSVGLGGTAFTLTFRITV